jgi:hypothetical protein
LPLIIKYQGVAKTSALVSYEKDKLCQISDEIKTSKLKQIYGAIKDGYDSNTISIEYRSSIEIFSEIDNEVEIVLNEIGINDLNVKNILTSRLVQYVDSVDLFDLIKKN